MSTQLNRVGVILMLLTAITLSASAQERLILQVTVKSGTCDVNFLRSQASRFLPLTPEDFNRHALAIKGSEPIVLSFPDNSCIRTTLAQNHRMQLMVNGPSALGGGGEAWGNRHEDLAWGMRLRYRGGEGSMLIRQITPNNNRFAIRQPSVQRHVWREKDSELVLQPEIYTWNYRRVRPQAGMAIPLIFSVVYE